MDLASLPGAFLTIFGTIFVAELTDKDALLLLALATKTRALHVFAAGAIAFTLTTAIIVTVGSALVQIVPIFWIKVAGGAIMLCYAGLELARGLPEESALGKREDRLVQGWRRSELAGLVIAVASLMLLDLAGDATELITVVFVAHFQDALLVFAAAAGALVAASALETLLGNRLGRVLTQRRIRILSIVIFTVIGAVILMTTFLSS